MVSCKNSNLIARFSSAFPHVMTSPRLSLLKAVGSLTFFALILFFTLSVTTGQPAASTRIILLGSGVPFPTPHRSGPATAIVVGSKTFLVDAGPGVARRMTEAGLETSQVDGLFFTHLHSDHTIGYPDLLLTGWVMGRTNPLQVFGPPGTREMSEHLLKAYGFDIYIRPTYGGYPPAGVQVNAHEAMKGVIYDDGEVKVTVFTADHGPVKPTIGFRFDTPDRSVVLSHDARTSPQLVQLAKGADVLVHGVYSREGYRRRRGEDPKRWDAVIGLHATPQELGKAAAEAGVKTIVITHVVFYVSDEELLEGIQEHFSGPVFVAKDLDVY